jgi:hypothetical protein
VLGKTQGNIVFVVCCPFVFHCYVIYAELLVKGTRFLYLKESLGLLMLVLHNSIGIDLNIIWGWEGGRQ